MQRITILKTEQQKSTLRTTSGRVADIFTRSRSLDRNSQKIHAGRLALSSWYEQEEQAPLTLSALTPILSLATATNCSTNSRNL